MINIFFIILQSPFDASLLSRGIKTLALRMDKQSENAQRLAEFLEKHSKVCARLHTIVKLLEFNQKKTRLSYK